MMGTPRGPSELVLLPLGGVGEIGMNCYLYGVGDGRGRKWIMVDLGVNSATTAIPASISSCPMSASPNIIAGISSESC